MLKLKIISTLCLLTAASSTCFAASDAPNLVQIGIDFSWSNTNQCSSKSPAFNLTNVPSGTTLLVFKMIDLNVRRYNHGGGKIEYTGNSVIPAGAFVYKGPCPPSGSHPYEFTVEALDSTGNIILGRGKAVREFPPK